MKTQMASPKEGHKRCVHHKKVAEPTGLEPATSDVTGRRSNQLNYDSAKASQLELQRAARRLLVPEGRAPQLVGTVGLEPTTPAL